jgi:hypothetical protein
MAPITVQLLSYAIAILPVALVVILSAAWWDGLARPWVFLGAGVFSLYGVLALMVIALIFIGPRLRGYFLEIPVESGERSSSVHALMTTTAIASVAFLIIGTAMLWALKQWLSKP